MNAHSLEFKFFQWLVSSSEITTDIYNISLGINLYYTSSLAKIENSFLVRYVIFNYKPMIHWDKINLFYVKQLQFYLLTPKKLKPLKLKYILQTLRWP